LRQTRVNGSHPFSTDGVAISFHAGCAAGARPGGIESILEENSVPLLFMENKSDTNAPVDEIDATLGN
jgi:hypothetical protein